MQNNKLTRNQKAAILFEAVMNRYDWRSNHGHPTARPTWRMYQFDGTDTQWSVMQEPDGTFAFYFMLGGGYPGRSAWTFLTHQEAIIQCAKAYEAQHVT